MITFKREAGVVTIVMSDHDYARLLMALGYVAVRANHIAGKKEFYSIVRVINELNAGNPEFTPYEVPDEEPPVEN
jgi:hypothetical protein